MSVFGLFNKIINFITKSEKKINILQVTIPHWILFFQNMNKYPSEIKN